MAEAIFKDVAVGEAFNVFFTKRLPYKETFFVSNSPLLCQKQYVCQHCNVGWHDKPLARRK